MGSISEIKYFVSQALAKIETVIDASHKAAVELMEYEMEVSNWEDNYGEEVPGAELRDLADSWGRLAGAAAMAAKAELNKIEWPEADDDKDDKFVSVTDKEFDSLMGKASTEK